MANFEERYYRRRIATAQITMVISITLVLFLLGLMGLIMLHARKLSDHVRENIGFSVMLKEDVREVRILEIKKKLELQPYVRSAEYIPREKAAERLRNELGEDFIDFLGENPLLPGIELRIKAPFANRDSLFSIEQTLVQMPEVSEVFYQKSLVDAINRNAERISLLLLGFGTILLFIAMVLINNTIRLSVYARRFMIRTMQLVGATEGFIRKPMVMRSIFHGLLSAFLALAMLMVLLWFAVEEIPELPEITDPLLLGSMVAALFILGALITYISTWLAVRKYLRIRTDLLYT